MTDILDVQRELANTRGEIEQTKGRMQYLEQSSAMSLIQVSLEQSKLNVEFTASTRNVKIGTGCLFLPPASPAVLPRTAMSGTSAMAAPAPTDSADPCL